MPCTHFCSLCSGTKYRSDGKPLPHGHVKTLTLYVAADKNGKEQGPTASAATPEVGISAVAAGSSPGQGSTSGGDLGGGGAADERRSRPDGQA